MRRFDNLIMNAMTILFSPKPFVGPDAVNQRNALAITVHFSVTRLGIAGKTINHRVIG